MEKYISHYSAACEWNIPHLEYVLNADKIKKIKDNQVFEITVSNPNSKYYKNGYIIQQCELPLPKGAVIKKNGSYVSSPELTFLQLANQLDLHRLVLLGLLMCSHPPGKPDEAISSKRKLESFIKKISSYHGQVNAKRAIKFIENGAASLMECIVFMILALPHSFGEYGLKGIKLRHRGLEPLRSYIN